MCEFLLIFLLDFCRLWYNGNMNPSYNSGSGSNAGGQNNVGVPGTKPGVIASGPDPEDTPISIPTASKESSRSKISSMLGRRKPSVNNRVLTSIDPQPMQLSANSGKPKKGLIFGGLAVIVILIIALVVGMTMGKNNNSGGGKVVSAEVAFNEASKFILFGDINSDKNINEVKIDDTAILSIAQEAVYEEQQKFFNDAKQYVDTLKKSIKNNQDVSDAVSDLEKSVFILGKISTILDNNSLLLNYAKEGKPAIQKQIDEIRQMDCGEDGFCVTVSQLETDFLTKTEELYQKFVAGKCVKDEEIDASCVEGIIDNDESNRKLQNNVVLLRTSLRKYIPALSERAVFSIKTIGEELNNV